MVPPVSVSVALLQHLDDVGHEVFGTARGQKVEQHLPPVLVKRHLI